MPYASIDKLIAGFGEPELIQLTDRDRTGEIDTAILADAQGRADREIDGYCRGRYPVPFVPVPDDIADAAVAITRYHLYPDDVPEYVQARYQRAIGWLRDVQAERVLLSIAAPASSGNLSVVHAEPRRGWADC